MKPEIGSIWRDNYWDVDYHYQRYVRVLKHIAPDRVRIQACQKDGSDLNRRSRATITKAERFGKPGRVGFTRVEPPEVLRREGKP